MMRWAHISEATFSCAKANLIDSIIKPSVDSIIHNFNVHAFQAPVQKNMRSQ